MRTKRCLSWSKLNLTAAAAMMVCMFSMTVDDWPAWGRENKTSGTFKHTASIICTHTHCTRHLHTHTLHTSTAHRHTAHVNCTHTHTAHVNCTQTQTDT